MHQRTAQAFALTLFLLASTLPIGARAQVGATMIPVEVATPGSTACNPAPGTVQPCYQAPTQGTSAAAAAPTSIPAPYSFTNPQTQVPQGVLANISTVILERVEQNVAGAINASVYVAQYLFVRIALISIILSFLGCMLDGEGLARAFRIAYWRFFEMSLWLTFISWTWQGPAGIPGWFPTIIGGIAAIGAQIADQVAGTPIATFQNYAFSFTIMPGTILDLGAGLFSAISTLAWAMLTGGGSRQPGLFWHP